MITLTGEIFLMNNLFKETREFIKYICIGDDDTNPKYQNTSLNNEIIRMTADIKYDLSQKSLIASADFDIHDLEDAKEIGLITNSNKLVSHDIFQGIPAGYESTIHLEYNLLLEPFYSVTGWRKTQYNDVYSSLVSEVVDSVYEVRTQNGYVQKDNLSSVCETVGSFFYDGDTQQLYVHVSVGDLSPSDLDIHVKVR